MFIAIYIYKLLLVVGERSFCNFNFPRLKKQLLREWEGEWEFQEIFKFRSKSTFAKVSFQRTPLLPSTLKPPFLPSFSPYPSFHTHSLVVSLSHMYVRFINFHKVRIVYRHSDTYREWLALCLTEKCNRQSLSGDRNDRQDGIGSEGEGGG